MKPEEQRIAIAEWCGWKRSNPAPYFGINPNNGNLECFPDFLNDLNAMHEAESKLDAEQLQYTYSHNLYNVVVPKNVQPFRATAAQRAEALLRTIGKWQDSTLHTKG